jgi:chorismate mutase
VTPVALKDFLSRLVVRKPTDLTDTFVKQLDKLRVQIDDYDSKILDVLGKRMKIADQIGALKQDHNVAILQTERWRKILEKMIAEGKNENLSEEFILRLFKAIHQESITHQQNKLL